MLFACGRATGSKARGWKIAVAILALSQAITLCAWFTGWFGSHVSDHPAAMKQEPQPDTFRPADSPGTPAIPAGSYGDLVRHWERGELPPPPAIADPVPAHPILSIAASERALGPD